MKIKDILMYLVIIVLFCDIVVIKLCVICVTFKGDYKCFATSQTGGMTWNTRDPVAFWQAPWNAGSEASRPPRRKNDHPEIITPRDQRPPTRCHVAGPWRRRCNMET